MQQQADVLDRGGMKRLQRLEDLAVLLAPDQGAHAAEFYTTVKTSYVRPQGALNGALARHRPTACDIAR